MTLDKTEIQLMTAPLQNLRQGAIDLDEYTFFGKGRWFASSLDDFSWVYGLSEAEVTDFARQYDNTKDEIKNIISSTDNEKLKDKLTLEYKSLPTLDLSEFTVDLDKNFWFLKTFRPLKKIRKTFKFKSIIDDIKRTCERMTSYIENVGWLELDKKNGG